MGFTASSGPNQQLLRRLTMRVWLCLAAFTAVILSGCGSSGGQFATVPPSPPPPSHVAIAVSPASVQPGQSATLSWSSFQADSCVASGDWSGAQQVNGTQNVMLPGPKSLVFTLSCTGPGGTATQTASLNVAEPPNACPAKPALAHRADRRVSRRRKPSPSSPGF
jgi:hypothetical protein